MDAIPVNLPVPPSLPQKHHKAQVDSVASRAIAASADGDVPSTLDVHIRWTVESGSIVQKGEKIAQLFYTIHGSPPPPPDVASLAKNRNAKIRARPKKKRWATASTPFAETSNKTQGIKQPSDSSFISLAIKANADGFLRILYTKTFVFNAVQIDPTESRKYSALNLILAAIEPCEHPAVVGGLCAVCGADTRAPKSNDVQMIDLTVPKKQQNNDSRKVEREEGETKVLRNERIDIRGQQNTGNPTKLASSGADTRQQKIIENQKKLAASMASSAEFDNDNDDELASVDMDAVLASHGKEPKQLPPNNVAKIPARAPKRPATGMRSLSSLLSGAKATQKMQQIPPRQKQPAKQKPAVSRRLRPTAMSSSTSNEAADPKMSKMTVSGGVTITISESEAKNISDASSKKLREEKKLALVLDLDHTLLHATDDYRAGRFVAEHVFVKSNNENDNIHGAAKYDDKMKQEKRDLNSEKREDVRSILLPVELPPAQQQQYVQTKLQQQQQGQTNFCLPPLPQQKQSPNSSIIMRHFIKLRPHLREFFSQIQTTYQLSVYTAGTRSYAEQVAIMICRHLVGAMFDEESLNTLRAKVREKDEECNKYREYRARIGRKRQLELLAKGQETLDGDVVDGEMAVDSKTKGSRKCVTFGGSADGDETEIKKYDSKPPSKIANGAPVVTKEVTTANGEKQSHVAHNDGECAALAPQKRRERSGDSKTNIPRKKKRLNTGSLLTLLPIKKETSEEGEEAEEEEPTDPSDDRDRLRNELDKAEKMEIAAVELRRKMFGSRIVSRTDVGDLGKDVKSLKRVFPCGGVMAAILDDREDVWANAKNNVTGRPGEPPENLLLVKPYHWKPFIGYADVNNASGNDLSKSDDDQRPADDKMGNKEDDVQLLWTAHVLRRLHERYYSTALSKEERDRVTVPSLLQSMRRETLLRFPRVKVVFSGLIPISKQNKQFQIRPQVVRYAEELGAEVLPKVSSETTHVVAARDGSEKIKQARKEVPGCYIVHTSWLMECFWSITRRDVRPHHMGPVPKQQALSNPKLAHSKNGEDNVVILLDSDEEDSDGSGSEDDFAADLEKEMMAKGK